MAESSRKKDSNPQRTEAVRVEIKGLSKKFGSQTVLQDISFSVDPGQIFVLMGPSGSGKSVLLKLIMTLLRPDSGSILIDGLDATDPKTHQKIVTSMVFQAGALFNSMNVYDNLAFYAKEHRLYDKKHVKEEVEHTLHMLSLENAAGKYPSELSGGMRKRVAIARSLMMKPQLILYDEPTSELDPIMAATIVEIIGTLKQKLHVTSIVVSHDVILAQTIANKVGVLFDGKLHSTFTPKELPQIDDERIQSFFNPDIDLNNPRFVKQ